MQRDNGSGSGFTNERSLPSENESSRLVRVLAAIAAARDADEVCEQIVACAHPAVSAAVLARVDLANNELVVLGCAGVSVRGALHHRHVSLDHPSALARAAREGKAVTSTSSELTLSAVRDPCTAFVAQPLRIADRIVGVLGVRCLPIDERDAILFDTLGSTLGGIIDRLVAEETDRALSRTLEEATRRLHEMARMSADLGEAGLDEAELLRRAVRSVAELFGDACLIRMLDPSGNLETVAMHDPDEARQDREGALNEDGIEEPTREALRRGRGVLLRHVRPRGELGIRKVAPVRSLLAAPIKANASACGAILLVRERRAIAYDDEDRLLLEDVAHRLSLGVSAARAYASAQQARQRAEEAARGRDRVLSIVAHDLRAPLTTVHLGLTLLKETQADAKTFDEVLGRVSHATVRMRRLADDLLDLGQIERGTLRVRRKQEDLHAVVSETVEELRPHARARGSALRHILSEPPLVVLGDRQRLQQMLVNLVVNAIEHTPAGTRIRVHARRAGERAEIVVTDNGPGVEPSLVESLFAVSTRAEETRIRGAGLGLWIAKNLVHAHEGDIVVYSRPGKGTRFVVTIPLLAA